MDALIHGFPTGGFDSLQPVIANTGQDLDHLPVTIIAALQLAPDRGHGGRQNPVLERGAIPQSTRFARQNRHIVPGIIDRLAPAEAARVLSDHHAILADDNAFGIGMHLDRTANGCRQNRVFIVVEPHGAGLRHRGRHAVEAIERAGIGNKMRPLGLEHLPDRLVGFFGMTMRPGIGHAFVHQPDVQLVQTFDPQARREEPLPDQPDLVLDLPLLPA